MFGEIEQNTFDDPRKRETRYYKREFTSNQEEFRMKSLLDEYRQKHGARAQPPKKEVDRKWGFYFYEDTSKTLCEVAFNPQDHACMEKIRKVPVSSLEFHQKRGDFARWIRYVFKNAQLAEAIENMTRLEKILGESSLIH